MNKAGDPRSGTQTAQSSCPVVSNPGHRLPRRWKHLPTAAPDKPRCLGLTKGGRFPTSGQAVPPWGNHIHEKKKKKKKKKKKTENPNLKGALFEDRLSKLRDLGFERQTAALPVDWGGRLSKIGVAHRLFCFILPWLTSREFFFYRPILVQEKNIYCYPAMATSAPRWAALTMAVAMAMVLLLVPASGASSVVGNNVSF